MSVRRSRAILVSFFVLCLAGCFVAGIAFHKYVGVSQTRAFLKSPAGYLRGRRRSWDSFQTLQYTKDKGSAVLRRYVQTALLPIVVDGKRLSDSYPVPKFGGAITVVNGSVIILDRLGGLYQYDIKRGLFERLRVPVLPNNLQAYLQDRRSSFNLGSPDAQSEFRAHGITFLSDRNELVVDYDQYDTAVGKLRTVVSVIPIDVATFVATGEWQQIFISDAYLPGSAFASGGRMAYRGDGKLYLTLGDHFTEPRISQDLNTALGKIIEIDLNSNKWRIFTMGHRNPQGLTFLKSGKLLSTEQGPRGGDELNIIVEGRNYGWPNVTLGTRYENYDNYAQSVVGSSDVGRHAGYTAPLFAWLPSIAVSQLIEINNFDPRWNGDLLVGSLKASSVYRVRLEADRVLYSEPIWIGQRIRDLIQTKDGTIVLWTDDTQLLFVKVDTDQLNAQRLLPAIVTDATMLCMGCHHLGPTNPADPAPSLSSLLNRPIASDTFRYSPGLRAKQGNWTKSRLVEFLSDPAKFANGTNMPNLGLDPETIEDIVDTLARASASSPAPAASR